jgi:hypothetical protein
MLPCASHNNTGLIKKKDAGKILSVVNGFLTINTERSLLWGLNNHSLNLTAHPSLMLMFRMHEALRP